MARPALDVVSDLFARRESGDVDGILRLLDPDVEVRGANGGRTYRGLDDVREFFWMDGGGEVETPLHDVVAIDGERVVASGRVRVRRFGRGMSDSPGAWLFDVRDSRIVRIDAFRSRREALASAAAH